MHIIIGDRFIYIEMQGLLLRLKKKTNKLVVLQHRWYLMAVDSHRFHCTDPLWPKFAGHVCHWAGHIFYNDFFFNMDRQYN